MYDCVNEMEDITLIENKSSIWGNQIFRTMFTAYAINVFGDFFDMIALMTLFSYTLHADPMFLALVTLSYAVPGLLFGQLGGILADRFDKRRLMIVADLLRAVITFGIVMSTNEYVILALLSFRSMAGTVHAPSQSALTRVVVTEEQLYQATSLNQ